LGKKRWRREDKKNSKKNPMRFFQHQEKLNDIFSYNENHKLGTTRRTIKEEEEELLQEKTLGSSFSAKRSSLGLFYVMKVCELKKFQKITCPTFFFSVKKILVGRDCGLVEKKLVKLLLAPRKARQDFFL